MRSTLILICALMLAGCLGGNGGNEAPTESSEAPSYDATQTFTIDHAATGCAEGGVLAMVEFAAVEKHLPEGFQAADAGTLLVQQDLNRGAFALNSAVCSNSNRATNGYDEATVSILIEHPDVEGVEPATYNFYELYRWTTKEEILTLFTAIGFNISEGRPSIQVQPMAGGGNTGAGDVKNDEDIVLHTLGMTSPSAEQGSFVGRYWHDTPNGLAYVEYTVSETTLAQGTGSCSLRSGPARDVMGIANCPRESLGLVLPNFKFDSKIVNLAGVSVT